MFHVKPTTRVGLPVVGLGRRCRPTTRDSQSGTTPSHPVRPGVPLEWCHRPNRQSTTGLRLRATRSATRMRRIRRRQPARLQCQTRYARPSPSPSRRLARVPAPACPNMVPGCPIIRNALRSRVRRSVPPRRRLLLAGPRSRRARPGVPRRNLLPRDPLPYRRPPSPASRSPRFSPRLPGRPLALGTSTSPHRHPAVLPEHPRALRWRLWKDVDRRPSGSATQSRERICQPS